MKKRGWIVKKKKKIQSKIRQSERSHRPPRWLNDYYTGNAVVNTEPNKVETVVNTHTSETFSFSLNQKMRVNLDTLKRLSRRKNGWMQ